MGYKRTDDLLPTIGFEKGVSNLLVEGDNKGVDKETLTDEEEDAGEEEGIADAIDRSESNSDSTW